MRRPITALAGKAGKQAAAMLERCADPAMLVDKNGVIVFWNRAAERLLGYRSQEVIGRACHEVIRGETLDHRQLCSPSCSVRDRLVCGVGVRNFAMQIPTKTGKPLWLNISSLPVRAGGKRNRFMAAHVLRDMTPQAQLLELADAIRAQTSGPEGVPTSRTPDRWAPSAHQEVPLLPPSLPLTRREREVLQLLARGEDTKSIAQQLCISHSTVRNHVQHILQKLGAHSRLQALAIAYHSAA